MTEENYQPPENGADGEQQSSHSEPLTGTEPTQEYDVPSVPGPNEIAIMLGELRKRENYGARVALEARCDMARLFAVMVDVHGYKGERYEQYARAHGAGKSEKDAYRMYKLASIADDVLAKCEAEERIDPRFEWPTWRQVVNKYFPPSPETVMLKARLTSRMRRAPNPMLATAAPWSEKVPYRCQPEPGQSNTFLLKPYH